MKNPIDKKNELLVKKYSEQVGYFDVGVDSTIEK